MSLLVKSRSYLTEFCSARARARRLGNKVMSLFARKVPGFGCADWSDTRLFRVSMSVAQIWLTLVAVIRMALLPTIYSQFFAYAPGNRRKTRAIVTFV